MRRSRVRVLALALVAALFAGLLTSALGSAPPAQAAVAVCSAATTQNGITVTPSHGSVFYIDSAASQRMDAAYLGYVVKSATARSDLWVSVTGFSGGSVALADPNDPHRSIGDLAANASRTAYFLAKAVTPTARAQAHTVTVSSGTPGLVGSTTLATCTFTFAQVKETIKANANKVTAVSTTPASTAGMSLGQTFTVKVEGDTGTIGTGSSPDLDMIWLSPAARSNWPAGSIRLESTQIRLGTTANALTACSSATTCRQYSDILLVRDLKTLASSFSGNAKSLNYIATYTFRVVGVTSAAVPILPVAQISSGTQVKHTTIPATALASIGTNDVVVNASVSKDLSTSVAVGTDPLTTTLHYTLTVTNSGTGAVTLDRIVDDADPTLTYVPGTVSGRLYTTTAGGTPSSTPVREPAVAPLTGDLIFPGPISVAAGGRLEVDYSMVSPSCVDGEPFSVTNSATAEIGTTVIGTTASTFERVLAQGTCGSDVIDPPDIIVETIKPEPVTLPTSAVSDTAVTLESTVDSNGLAGAVVRFEWGTSAELVGAASKTVSTTGSQSTPQPFSASLTGLQTGTTYYYRVVVDVTAANGTVTSYRGRILPVTTTEPVGAPVVTTLAASGVSRTGATLNGSIDPNQTDSYVAFTISKTSTLPALSSTRVTIRDDQDAASSGSNPDSLFSGAFATPFSLTLAQAGLTIVAGDTWYYRADIVNASGTVLSSGAIRSVSLVTTSPQTLAFDPIADAVITDGTTSSRAVATSGLPPSVRTETPTVCRIDSTVNGVSTLTLLAVGDCTLVADQEGGTVTGTVYEPSNTATATFVVTRAPRTLSLAPQADLLDWAQPAPHVEATPSVGEGEVRYSRVAGDGVCTVDAVTGMITPLAPGTCSVAAVIGMSSVHDSAEADPISFTIGRRTQRITIDDESITLASGGHDLLAISDADTHVDGMGAIEYALVAGEPNTAGCTLSAGRLSVTSLGSCTVEASRSGNSHWTTASDRAVYTVSDKISRRIDLRVPSGEQLDLVPDAITDWSTSELTLVGVPSETDAGDAITYTVPPGDLACSVDEATGRVVITGSGKCIVRASVAGSSRLLPSQSDWEEIVIGPRRQSITDFVDAEVAADLDTVLLDSGTDATINADGISEPVYTIAEGSTDGCAIVNGHLTFTQAGDCLVKAERSGNAHWTAATALSRVTIARVARSIDFDEQTRMLEVADWSAAPHQSIATPTAGAGDGTVRYSTPDPDGPCSIEESTGRVIFTGAGECVLQAQVGPGARYGAATAKDVVIPVGKRPQAITGLTGGTYSATTEELALAPVSNAAVNDADMAALQLRMTGPGVGPAVALRSAATTSACRLDGTVLIVDSAGSCTIEAARPGGAHWTSATASATYTFVREPRTLTLYERTRTSVSWSATAPAVLPLVSHDAAEGTLRYGTEEGSACTIDDITGALTLLRAGECAVTATITESARYSSAVAPVYRFTISLERQTITGLPAVRTSLRTGSIVLAAVSNATRLADGIGPISYTASGACELVGDQLRLVRAGTCTVSAARAGNDNWTDAIATSSFTVDPIAVTGQVALDSGRSSLTAGQADRAVLTTSIAHPSARTWRSTSRACTVDGAGAVRAVVAGTCTIVVTLPATDQLSSVTATLEFPVLPGASTVPPTTEPTAPPVAPTPPSSAAPAAPSPTASASGVPATLRDAISVRTVPELAREAMGGFAPGSTVRADISGARTVAQFVVAGNGEIDRTAVIAALAESIDRRAGGFADVVTVESGAPEPSELVDIIGPAMIRTFAETRLGAPRVVGELDVDSVQRWVRSVVDVTGLRPGSRVALAVTSDPIIVGDAVARADGTARVTGWIPLDLLEPGAHSIRVVGVRELVGATVDERGEVRMTPAILQQIGELDPGTAATLTITGSTRGADTLIAQRRVLLDDITPWWALVLLAAGVAAVAIARRFSPAWTRRRRGIAVGAIAVLAIVVAVAGWYTAAYGIYTIGLGLAALGAGVSLMPSRARRRRSTAVEMPPLEGRPVTA